MRDTKHIEKAQLKHIRRSNRDGAYLFALCGQRCYDLRGKAVVGRDWASYIQRGVVYIGQIHHKIVGIKW